MPDEMYRVFTHYKGDEWARFNATVTEWDVAALPRLPALTRRRTHVRNCRADPSRHAAVRIGQEMTAMLQSLEASRARLHRLRALRQARRRPAELRHPLQGGRAGGDAARLQDPRPGPRAPGRGQPAHGRDGRRGQSTRTTRPTTPSATTSPMAAICRKLVDLHRGRRGLRDPLGRARARADQGPGRRRHRGRPVRAAGLPGHARASATPAWPPSPTSTSARRTPTGPIRSATSRSSTTAS